MAGLIRSWQRLSVLSPRVAVEVAPALTRSHSTVAYASATAKEEAAPAAPPAGKVKRPSTAYSRFVKENYGSIAAQHPDKKGVKELGKIVGEQWGALSEAEKNKYKEAAAAAKAEFDKQYPDGPPAAAPKAAKKVSTRAPSAYNVFVKQRLPLIKAEKGVATKDAMSLAGKEWSSLTQAQKDEYKPKAQNEYKPFF